MEHAKKMMLIDEREYERLKRPLAVKTELSWKRPIETRAKHEENVNMKSVLADETMPDDVKVKEYNQMLTRFINARTKLDQSTKLIDLDEPTPTSPIQAPAPLKAKKKTTKKTIKRASVPYYSPIQTRKLKPSKRFSEVEWIEF